MSSVRLKALQRKYSNAAKIDGEGLDLPLMLRQSQGHIEAAMNGFRTYQEDLNLVARSAHEIPPDLQDIVDGHASGRYSWFEIRTMALMMLDAERVLVDSWTNKLRVMNLQLKTEQARRQTGRPEESALDKFMSTIDTARLEFQVHESNSLLAICKRALVMIDRQTKYWSELNPTKLPPNQGVPPESPAGTSKSAKQQKKRKGGK